MSADPLGSGFYYNVGAEFQWPYEVSAGTKSIVYDQWKVILFCKRHKFLEVGDVQPWIANGLQVDRLCIFIDERHKAFHIVAVAKPCFNTEAFEGHFELVVGSAVKE